MTEPNLCIVVKGFPRVSETFITRELENLETRGLNFALASLRAPAADAAKVTHNVRASVNYLPEYLHDELLRVLRGYATARRLPGFATACRLFRADLRRDLSRNRVRRFGQAMVLAAEMPNSVRHLHAHFIHTPAAVTRYAAAMRGLTFSVSAHAKDIWTSPEWDLNDKLNQAQFVAVCNRAGHEKLSSIAPRATINLWPHQSAELSLKPKSWANQQSTVKLITVARAVPKKGLESLLAALAHLPVTPLWTWTHIGGGEGLANLRKSAKAHPFAKRIRIAGSLQHAEVLAKLATHDVFILPAMVAEDGDRDGRPNAMIEAMASGLACVGTPVGGIPELIDHGTTGLLAQPDPKSLADAITYLLNNTGVRSRLGDAAAQRASAIAREGSDAFEKLASALAHASASP